MRGWVGALRAAAAAVGPGSVPGAFRQRFDFGGRDVASWFPGHMAKGLRQMRASLRRADCLIEVHDARIPLSGRNPMLREVLGIRPHVLVLNKRDLADPQRKPTVLEYLKQQGCSHVVFTDCQRDDNVKKIVPLVAKLVDDSPRYHRAEVCEKPLMYLVDTPGVLPPKLEDVETGVKLALCGAIRDHLVGEDIMADYLLYTLNKQQQFGYVQRYGLAEACDAIEPVLRRVALARGRTQKVKVLTGTGNVNVTTLDYSAAAYEFLRDFRAGCLGRVTLD
ncbi:mitochondrial ribosome-associated GTPase 1 isoform X3 [Rissa tridactyla]|uniref:mitochondrial ribosome-associated GTPase 1 isoform X3 n=1 Tax=Rissa tridactyla TaxID=75485 RepID=UPI0023BA5266|nr:mitochondrial ribosome-associated GTPase 1 isoform X3 [Rissa tridactyla]